MCCDEAAHYVPVILIQIKNATNFMTVVLLVQIFIFDQILSR